jgi:hypothetical protein
MSSTAFHHLGSSSALLPGYHWIHVDDFLIVATSNAEAVDILQSYVVQQIFRRSFTQPLVADYGTTIHGPYVADSIDHSFYELLAPGTFRDTYERLIRELVTGAELSSDDLRPRVARAKEICPISEQASVFRLRVEKLDDFARHGGVQVLDYFSEFVIIDASDLRMKVCVLGAD